MIDDRVRDDIALIREAIEEGRGYATASGQGLVVWGIALAAGFVATYAFVRGYQSALPPTALWPLAIAVPWAYWLRWVAVAWWIGELALVALRHRPEALLLSAGLMLALLAGPGIALVLRRRKLLAAA